MICTWCPKAVPTDSPSDWFCTENCQRGWAAATERERVLQRERIEAQIEARDRLYRVSCSCQERWTNLPGYDFMRRAYELFGYAHYSHSLNQEPV